MSVYVIVIAAYAAVLLALGLESARRTRSAADFLVAGRGLSGRGLFVSLLAANIGAGSTVGAAGLGYKFGLSAWWWVGAAGIGSTILALSVGPRLWRIAQAKNFYTVGDFFRDRFGDAVRYQVAAAVWAGSLVILASQLIAIAWILNVVAGVSKPVGCAIGGALATGYFAAGGMKGTIRINAVQLVIKLTGFAAALAFMWRASDDPSAMAARLSATLTGAERETYFGFFNSERSIGWLALLAPAFIVSPGLLQKIYAARDERAARNGTLANAGVLLLYAAVPALIGMLARAWHPGLPNHEMALPTIMTEFLPTWLGAFLLAAVFSAEVGTADAVLFMLSTSLTQDLYRGLVRPDADERRLLRVSRIVAFSAGCLGVLFAVALSSIIQGLTIFYSLISAVMAIPLLAGLYAPRATGTAVAWSIPVSVVTLAVVHFVGQGKGVFGVPSQIVAILAGGACAATLTAVYASKASASSSSGSKSET
jgi:SSS family solute:Na+ symporter